MTCQPGYTPLEFCVLDADVPRYIEALSTYFGYQEFLDPPDNQEPNPQSRGAFAQQSMSDWMEQRVIEHELRVEAGEIVIPPVDVTPGE
jgi:hypothetical protein